MPVALRKTTGKDRAWALGTLAELELLGVVYGGDAFNATDAREKMVPHSRALVDAVGKDAFPVASTRRQFIRYLRSWPHASWNGLAEHAIEALPEGASWVARAYDPGG